MAQTSNQPLPQWLIYFDTIDSTNNYAMQLAEDGMAQHGKVIWAKQQTGGKGQRGKQWQDDVENLKFSLIIKPFPGQSPLFELSAKVATILAVYLKSILPESCHTFIKWPNDIYINDKKAAGVLIENVFRGMHWNYSVIGIGLNVNQKSFSPELTRATSLKKEAQKTFDQFEILRDLRSGILNSLIPVNSSKNSEILASYNDLLYKRNQRMNFRRIPSGDLFEAIISHVDSEGMLVLDTKNGTERFSFGTLEWLL